MVKKFTEKQYNTLIEVQLDYFSTSIFYASSEDISTVSEALQKDNKQLWDFIIGNELENEAIALMNPISRPYVKNDLVLKENKYYWGFQSQTVSKDDGKWVLDEEPGTSDVRMFTKSEIIASPFDINQLTPSSELYDLTANEPDLPF